MAIQQTTVADTLSAVGFTDDLRAACLQLAAMKAKIERYAAALAAVAGGTADPREAKFAEIVQLLVSAEDLARIGALLPTITTFCEEIETNYADFIS